MKICIKVHVQNLLMTFSSKYEFYVKKNIMRKVGLCRNGEHCIPKLNRNSFQIIQNVVIPFYLFLCVIKLRTLKTLAGESLAVEKYVHFSNYVSIPKTVHLLR